jgi:hypothetical protein
MWTAQSSSGGCTLDRCGFGALSNFMQCTGCADWRFSLLNLEGQGRFIICYSPILAMQSTVLWLIKWVFRCVVPYWRIILPPSWGLKCNPRGKRNRMWTLRELIGNNGSVTDALRHTSKKKTGIMNLLCTPNLRMQGVCTCVLIWQNCSFAFWLSSL